VALLDMYELIPMPPAPCRPAVESVALTCQDDGSLVPSRQNLARNRVPVPDGVALYATS